MALRLKKEYKGVLADYWRVRKWTNDVDSAETVVILFLYKDRTTRDADKTANVLETKQVILPLVDGGIADIYAALKSQSITTENAREDTLTEKGYFVDAVDILEKKNDRKN